MATVLDAINVLGKAAEGKNDKETHKLIKKVIICMEDGNKKWPDKALCKLVFKLKPADKNLFLNVLRDMDQGLAEHFTIEV